MEQTILKTRRNMVTIVAICLFIAAVAIIAFWYFNMRIAEIYPLWKAAMEADVKEAVETGIYVRNARAQYPELFQFERFKQIDIVLSSIIVLFILICFSSVELVLSDKRIYGKTLWGRKVDIPLDSIGNVKEIFFNGVVVTSSSRRFSFPFLKDKKVYDEICNAIKPYQNGFQNNSQADELKKFKELMDQGVITQEEFEAKKKQILDL